MDYNNIISRKPQRLLPNTSGGGEEVPSYDRTSKFRRYLYLSRFVLPLAWGIGRQRQTAITHDFGPKHGFACKWLHYFEREFDHAH